MIAREMLRESRAFLLAGVGRAGPRARASAHAPRITSVGRPGYAEAALDALGLASGRGRARPRGGHGEADAAARAAVRAGCRGGAAGRDAGGARARVVPEAETLPRQRGRHPARGRRARCRLRRRRRSTGSRAPRRCRDRARAPAARHLAILFNHAGRRLRADAAGGLLGRVPRGRDREAAGADGEHRVSGRRTVPRARSSRSRGELPESGRARPGAGSGAGVLVEHDRGAAGGRARRRSSRGSASSCPTGVYRHPLRTELYWTRLR